MKKFYTILFLLPFLFLSSCDNSDDLVEVDVTLHFSGVTLADGSLYAIEGETVTIDNVTVESLTSQNAVIQRVGYYLDGKLLFPSAENPFSASFNTTGFRIGRHEIGMTGVVLQVDKSLTNIQTLVPLVIVKSIDDLPAEAPEIGSYSVTMSTNWK